MLNSRASGLVRSASFRRLCVAYVGFLALFLNCSPTDAQTSHMSSGSPRITGHVRDSATQQPLTSVRVQVSQSGGVAQIYVVSGTDGEFRIGGIGDGNYDVIVDEKGYKPFRENVSLANGNVATVIIDLEKAPGERESAPGTLSAHELAVPQKARDAYAKGMTLKAKPDYAGALEQFQKAIKAYPDFYEAYAEAGVSEGNLNQPENADRDLQKSIDLSEGKYAPALFYMAGEMNNGKRFAEAESTAKKGIELDPQGWRGQFEMARALLGQRRATEALPYAAKARDLNPGNSQVYIVVMNASMGTHDYPGAVSAIDGFLKLTPTGPQADQVRHVREQLEAAIKKASVPPAPVRNAPTSSPK